MCNRGRSARRHVRWIVHKRIHKNTHVCTPTNSHPQTHTHTHPQTYTHTQTHTHTEEEESSLKSKRQSGEGKAKVANRENKIKQNNQFIH